MSRPVCKCGSFNCTATYCDALETGEANARLIAAAPDLLAALKLAYDWSRFVAASGTKNTDEFIAELFERGEAVQEAARAAIKKAEGKL